jgi:hypothetical protein
MIEGIGDIVILREPEDIVAFVTNLNTYKMADLKIGRVLEQRTEGNSIFMKHDGSLRGIPGPAVSLEMKIESQTKITYRAVPTFPSRFILDFNGGFELTLLEKGTRVIHVERFHFKVPFKFVAEPFLRNWLQTDIAEEMKRLKLLLEAP